MTETVIRAGDDVATVINVFETQPDKQQELVGVLNEGLDKVVRHRPGFVSATILASKDGSKVVNYAQWRSPADAQATFGDPAVQEYGKKAAALGTPAPGVYSVDSVTLAP
ncbi:antibiotic biosynthesis monooxygenase [Streptomyces sp. NA04227]|uniref:putative quinol monooxygenase n=1 Tax=Streptomyces sp. NA04227 TaxID=2742136 RepID=UPI0015911AD1|nr:antibiotic biosynthesis monooxygenase [Streptomyces sp. NA04227]QKW08097.1 antibiotic biosynthesis monooxygenase [Streptomyces sp. NA04227]